MTQALIIFHIICGCIALVSGAFAISSKKGSLLHKKSGKIFYYAMLFGVSVSCIVSFLPNHQNPFLFAIGVFSLYLVIGGKRSLSYKNPQHNFSPDKLVSLIMLLTGIGMIVLPIILKGKINIILLVFGIIGIVFALRDITQYKNPSILKEKYLSLHIGKITGGYIAAVSAFLVVNQVFPGVLNWFLPTIPGTAFITYWLFKIKKK